MSEGRRVGSKFAVPEPKVEEMVFFDLCFVLNWKINCLFFKAMVCKFLKLDCILEVHKRHPADFFNTGRIRVKLFDENKAPCNAEIKNKKQLLEKIGELIPNLKTRGASAKDTGTAQKSG